MENTVRFEQDQVMRDFIIDTIIERLGHLPEEGVIQKLIESHTTHETVAILRYRSLCDTLDFFSQV